MLLLVDHSGLTSTSEVVYSKLDELL